MQMQSLLKSFRQHQKMRVSLPRVARLHVIKSVSEMHAFRRKLYSDGDPSVGFVPTMGALHEGHMALMKHSRQNTDLTIASIFVNPTQFSPGEDLDKYPRQIEADMKLLEREKVDVLFLPDVKGMYPSPALNHVEPAAFSTIFEGSARPEFFRGVATIVTKLFNIVRPDQAFFGQKDISQCILVNKLVQDLNIPTKIKVIETLRDPDGLAMSSRNAYLMAEERQVASVLYRALEVGVKLIQDSKEPLESGVVIAAIEAELHKEKQVKRIEYISLASHLDMKELSSVDNQKGCVISSAIRLGNVRLIDNLLVGRAYSDIVA